MGEIATDARGAPEAPPVRFEAIPAALAERKQWLLWRYEPGEKKPRKVPYYVGGGRRAGRQGDARDRARLATLARARAKYAAGGWAGVGFAFLPGDGLFGVDIDAAIDADGVIDPLAQELISACGSWTERSPSGRGVHVFLAGVTRTHKVNAVEGRIGLEIFCEAQFFTVTGQTWPGAPDQVAQASPALLEQLHAVVERLRAPASAPPPAPVAASGDSDFARVNAAALADLRAWAEEAVPGGRWYDDRYRVTSRTLGRDREEDLSFAPAGIRDYGDEEGLTPIDVVVKFRGLQPAEALHWLATRVGIVLERRTRSARPPEDPPPPPEFNLQEPPAGKSRRRRVDADRLRELFDHFVLVYGTDTVVDTRHKLVMRISALGHAYGSEHVRMWKASPQRRMAMPEDVIFDPACAPDARRVNLFHGWPIRPHPGDVEPWLELLRYLMQRAHPDEEERAKLMDWVLCWLALPLQRPGSKNRSALIFHGEEGIGKNLLFETVQLIYGRYGKLVGQDELEDRFNDWRSCALFVIGDEVVAKQELVHNKNRLKGVITQPTVFINPKGLPRREEKNQMNVVFLSNELKPMALDNSDRRYFVVWHPPRRDDALYARVRAWREGGGVAALYDYLLRYDLGDFDEHWLPPMTEAKRELIELNRSSAERFLQEWIEQTVHLPLVSCTLNDLYRAYCKYCQRVGERFPVPQPTFTRQLERLAELVAGAPDPEGRLIPPMRAKVIKLAHGQQAKAYRCWRIGEPPAGATESRWATDQAEAFRAALGHYLQWSTLTEEGA